MILFLDAIVEDANLLTVEEILSAVFLEAAEIAVASLTVV